MISDLKQRLRVHILAGGTPKEFAIDNALQENTAGKLLASMGIKKVFITEAEHAAIINQRRRVTLCTHSSAPATPASGSSST